MTRVVVDASIAAKWVLRRGGEPLAEEAALLLESYRDGEVQFLVPDLFWAEVGNVLWKAIRARRCGLSDAQTGLKLLNDLRIPTVASHSTLDRAISIAAAFDRTVYDSLYVAVAILSKCEFITADEKLVNALAARLPVKWLGAYF